VRGPRKRALHMRIYRALLQMYRDLLRIPNPLLEAASAMGWLRLVGSLKLQVSFAEHSLFYRALLQKRPIILRSLLLEATPYSALLKSVCACVCVCMCACACDTSDRALVQTRHRCRAIYFRRRATYMCTYRALCGICVRGGFG